MVRHLGQLEKLRGKSFREIRARGAQELTKLNERIFGAGSVEMTDTALMREIRPGSRNGNGEGSAMLLLERIRSAPGLPLLTRPHEASAIIKQRFSAERTALLDRAERAIRGRFDLLGFSDLSFGDPIDWCFDPTTGKRTPLVHWSRLDYLDPNVAGDKKVTWELNRHAHFVTLGQAYWLTGDERFANAFTSQAISWMDANPPKRGINWASSLELSFRVISWIWALHLFSDSDRLTPRFVSRFLKYLVAQGFHIETYLSHYFSPNTHLTGEALGLVYLGSMLPELDRARCWQETGLAVLLDQLPRHIRPDGTYFEQSSYYHRYTVDFYLNLVVLARATGVKLPIEVEERLALALDHLMFITKPDGATPIVGDDDGGRLLTLNARRANDFRDTLATGAALLGRGDWKFVAGDAPVETLWLLGPAGLASYDQIEASAPVDSGREFTDGGCYLMRDGWAGTSSYVFVDCGVHGSLSCGHAHADSLAFEYAAGGTTWLVDPGTFTYTGDPSVRNEFRTTEAHNTLAVDRQPQSVPAGPFGWQHIASSTTTEFISENAFDYFEGWHDGYQRFDDPVTHTRSVLLLKRDNECELPSYLIVRDRLTAASLHQYELRYHFAAGCSVKAVNNEARATANDHGLSIRVFGNSELTPRIEDGWVSSCYGRREPAPVALFESSDRGPQEFLSFLIPAKPRASVALWPLLIDKGPRDAQEGVAIERGSHGVFLIGAGRSRDFVLIGEQKTEEIAADGSMAWARFLGGAFVHGCVLAGRSFEIPECLTFHSQAKVRSCVFSAGGGSIEISIQGTRQFDLSFVDPPNRIVVNESSFELKSGCREARFVVEGSEWRLLGAD